MTSRLIVRCATCGLMRGGHDVSHDFVEPTSKPALDTAPTVYYTNNDDGIWLSCRREGCNWDKSSGHNPSLTDLNAMYLQHRIEDHHV